MSPVVDSALRWKRRRRRFLGAFARRFPLAALFLGAPSPITACEYRIGSQPTRDLLVCLPGIADVVEDYDAYGFVESVIACSTPADVVAVDAHFGYYARRTIIDRLRDDAVRPARAAGYERVWLVGISLGGFGALAYAAAHPEDVHGLILLAPYLGDDALVREIAAAGGIGRWEPGASRANNFPRRVWTWLKEIFDAERRPVIILGFGAEDAFAPAARLLAGALPSERVLVIPGGHDWETWKRLWDRIFVDPKQVGLGI